MRQFRTSGYLRRRYFCPKFFRQIFVEYAGQSMQESFWARPYYAMQRAKGKEHHVRALAYKWIRIIRKCWQTRTPYSEVKYLESLRKKGSPLLAFAANLNHSCSAARSAEKDFINGFWYFTQAPATLC